MPSRRRFLQAAGVAAILGAGSIIGTAANSHVRWTWTPSASGHQYDAITKSHDGGVVIAGRTGSSNEDTVRLVELGPDGNERWTRTFDGPGFPAPVAVTRVGDGYVFAGTVGPASHRAWLVRLDPTGNEVWRRTYSRPQLPWDVVVSADRIYVCGQAGRSDTVDTLPQQWILAVNRKGKPQWSKTYEHGSFQSAVSTESDVLLAGRTAKQGQQKGTTADRDHDAAVLTIDSSGGVVHRQTVGGVRQDEFSDVDSLPNGGVLAGETASPTLPENRYRTALLVRTDPRGRVIWRRTPDLKRLNGVTATSQGIIAVGVHTESDRWQRLVAFDRWGRERRRLRFGKSGWASDVIPAGDGEVIVAGGGATGPWAVRIDPGA